MLNEFIIQTKRNADKTDGSKKAINNINRNLYLTLAKQIGEIRNEKIKSSLSQIQGYDVKKDDNYKYIYHVLMPYNKRGKPIIYVGEISYDLIDIDNIKIKGCLEKPSNFSFSDGKHEYSFTPADSQLWMDFDKTKIIKDTWNVLYIDDATAMQLFVRDVRKELLHIYMSDEVLQDFLKNVDVKDLKGIKKYISENGNKVLVNEDDSMENISEGLI